jgi:multiple sugar transport system permease protein
MSSEVGARAEVEREAIPAPPLERTRRRQNLVPYLLLAPAGIFLAIFFVWPMVQALVMGFRDPAGNWTLEYVRRMAGDINFWPAIRDTLLLILAIVPVQMVLALIMALLLNAGLRGTSFWLYAWAVPLAISDLAAGIVWLAIFTDRGYINSLLVSLGLSRTGFAFLSYEHPISIFFVVVIAEAWRATSIVMVILVAGLQVIPKEYSEAAEVFGATGWQRLRHVTLPLLRPSLQVALILRTILAFQVFAVVIALAGRNLPILAGEAYYWYGSYSNPNVAAVYSLLIMLFSVVSTVVYLRMLQSSDAEMGMAS